MQVALKIAGAALGVIVPALFIWALLIGIRRSPLPDWQKRRWRIATLSIVLAWVALTWIAAVSGLIRHQAGDAIPRWMVALAIPVAGGLVAMASAGYRTILASIPLPTVVGVQTFRFAGVAFLFIVGLGILPRAFALGGYGDLATGALALVGSMLLARRAAAAKFVFWAFHAVGLADLLNVAYLLLIYDPIWYDGRPTSAAAGGFSLVMIPAIAAPLALLLHVYAIYASVRSEERATSARPVSATA